MSQSDQREAIFEQLTRGLDAEDRELLRRHYDERRALETSESDAEAPRMTRRTASEVPSS